MSFESLAPAIEPLRWRSITVASLVAVEVALAWRLGWSPALPATLFLGAVLTVAAVVDARTSRVPNVLVLPAYPVGLALFAVAAGMGGQWWPLVRAVLGMAGVAGFYLALAVGAGGKKMGLGDVTAGGLTGLLLGLSGFPAVFVGVLLGWAAALVAVVVLGRVPTRKRGSIPAVPWLWLGALVVLLVAR